MELDEIVIPFPEELETRPGFPCRAFRWTFQIHEYGRVFGFYHQYHLGGEWNSSHTTLYSIAFHLKWNWSEDHFWYDGPHCMRSFGFFTICWYRNCCKKCLGYDK